MKCYQLLHRSLRLTKHGCDLWILRFNSRYIRASLVNRTIQKGHTYYSTNLIHITRPQVKINIVKKQYRVTYVYFTFSQPS